MVIAALANAADGSVDDSGLETILRESGVRILIRELQNAPQILQDWDLIEPVHGGYCFRMELLRQWIAANRPLKRAQEVDRVQPLAENLYRSAYGFYRANDLPQAETLLRSALNVNPNRLRATTCWRNFWWRAARCSKRANCWKNITTLPRTTPARAWRRPTCCWRRTPRRQSPPAALEGVAAAAVHAGLPGRRGKRRSDWGFVRLAP